MQKMKILRDYIPLPYLRDVQPEDVEQFRRIPPHKLEEILKETPKCLLEIIGNVLPAFLLKENVSLEEAEQKAEELTKKLEAGIRFLVECCQKSIIHFIWQVLFPVRSKGHLRYWDLRGYRYWGLSLR